MCLVARRTDRREYNASQGTLRRPQHDCMDVAGGVPSGGVPSGGDPSRGAP
jgi:hypothetical protein